MHPERITQKDKELVNDLNYDGMNLLCEKNILTRLKRSTIFGLMRIFMKIS